MKELSAQHGTLHRYILRQLLTAPKDPVL